MKKLTVLMPVYNGSAFIENAIKSVLTQTFSDFEFIIVNDGSTDQTDEIISSFNDQRIVYKKKEHSGLSDTLNYGIRLSQTNLIARMDVDDIADPNRLWFQYNFISANPDYDIIGTNINVINSSNRIIYRIKYPEIDLGIKKNLLINSVIAHPTVLMKKNMFDKVGFYDVGNDSIQDYHLWLRSLSIAKFYNIQKYLYYYRKNGDSLTGAFNKFNSDRKKVSEMMREFLSENCELKFITDSEKDYLNTKFLVRYSPNLEIKSIFMKSNLSIWEKVYISIISLIPFKLKSLYFFFNPKQRIIYFIQSLSKFKYFEKTPGILK